MVAPSTERRQILAYDKLIKTGAWKSLLLVNPKGDAEVNGLLAFCPMLRITVLWDSEFMPPLTVPTEPLRRRAVLARLRVTAGANSRLRLLAGDPLLLAAQLAREQNEDTCAPFSGAILARLDPSVTLASQLRFWAALVDPAGTLIGKQLDMKLRTELSGITPLWRSWPNGLWLLDVKHVLPEISPEIRRELPETPEVDGGRPQDRSLEIAPDNGEISGTLAVKPQVMNLKRTRPVWETLEQNLAR